MRTSPSSSSTSSTSTTTFESSNSVISFLVFAQQSVGCFMGKCYRSFGVLVLRGLIHRLGRHGQREQEPRAFGVSRVEPDPPAKILDDLPGHGEADAGARVGAPLVQALEDHEDPLGVLRFDPDAVVSECEQPERLVAAGGRSPRWRRSPLSTWPGCTWPGPARCHSTPGQARARTGPPGCTGAGR